MRWVRATRRLQAPAVGLWGDEQIWDTKANNHNSAIIRRAGWPRGRRG